MGFFGRYVYDGTRWLPLAEHEVPSLAEPWLSVDIYDSDITTVVYRPAGQGSGVAYLGDTPRTYFADETASAPTDTGVEAAALAAWWARRHGASDDARDAKARELIGYLAADGPDDPGDYGNSDYGNSDYDDLADADVFVEVTTARFLAVLDLPVPDGLPS